MERHKYPGLFIALEGLDGAGISTQAQMLEDRIKAEGYKTLLTKEPTNNIIGGLIRGQLTNDWKTGMDALQLLFAADRAHHLEREVIPALKAGLVVISDRYLFSTIAFGSVEVPREWLLKINDLFILPDIAIVLRLTPEESTRRMRAARFRMELFEEREERRKILETYEWIAKHFDRVKILDAERPIKEISGDVFTIVRPLLARASKSG
jgi:dTMP kinase